MADPGAGRAAGPWPGTARGRRTWLHPLLCVHLARWGAEVPNRSAALRRLLRGSPAMRPSGLEQLRPGRKGGSRAVALHPGGELSSPPWVCRHGQAWQWPGCGSRWLVTCCPGPAPRGRQAGPGTCAAQGRAGPGRCAAGPGPAPRACGADAAGTAQMYRPSAQWPACSCP